MRTHRHSQWLLLCQWLHHLLCSTAQWRLNYYNPQLQAPCPVGLSKAWQNPPNQWGRLAWQGAVWWGSLMHGIHLPICTLPETSPAKTIKHIGINVKNNNKIWHTNMFSWAWIQLRGFLSTLKLVTERTTQSKRHHDYVDLCNKMLDAVKPPLTYWSSYGTMRSYCTCHVAGES